MNIRDVFLARFHWMSRPLSKVFRGLEADLDAARGTTTGSDVVGYYLSVLTTNSTQLDESTASSSSEQFIIVKNHPDSTTKTLVKVVEQQVFN